MYQLCETANALLKKRQQTAMALGKRSGQQRLALYVILLAATIGCISAGNICQTNCVVVKENICSNYFNGNLCSYFPTSTRDLSMKETISEFSHFLPLLKLDNYCSYLLHTVLCYHYYPACTAQNHLLPCRGLCEEVFDECLTKIYKSWKISAPDHLNCSRFPSALSCPTICPPPGMLLIPFFLKFYIIIHCQHYRLRK